MKTLCSTILQRTSPRGVACRPVGFLIISTTLCLAFFAILEGHGLAQGDSYFQIQALRRGMYGVQLTGLPEFYYVLYRGYLPDRISEAVDMRLGGGPQELVLRDPGIPSTKAAFYRVQAFSKAVPGDLDGDGIDDLAEMLSPGTGNPLVREPYSPVVPRHWSSIAAGRSHTLMIARDGSLWAWGSNGSSQLGAGLPTFLNNASFFTNAPVAVDVGHDWATVAAGRNHSLAIRSDGTLWAWGENVFGQLGVGRGVYEARQPIQVGQESTWVGVAAGDQHSIGLRADGSLWAWGDNDHGQLGTGTFNGEKFPVRVGTVDDKWRFVATGDFQTLAIKADGSLWAWGANSYGQLGLGLSPSAYSSIGSPSKVGGGAIWSSVACGYHHTIGIQADGTGWAWGGNEAGSLGNGTTSGSTSPVAIGGGLRWRSIQAGAYHSMGIASDGSLWLWGLNDDGELGTGKYGFKKTPALLSGGLTWTGMCGGLSHTIAIDSEGNVWAWGGDASGQLGMTAPARQPLPLVLPSLRGW